jgi:hypothetical protein
MTRCTLRNIFTVMVYAGVGVFLFPYLTGHLGHALMYLLIGIGVAVVFGILRCCCVEGDCTDPEAVSLEHRSEPSQQSTPSHPRTHSSI